MDSRKYRRLFRIGYHRKGKFWENEREERRNEERGFWEL